MARDSQGQYFLPAGTLVTSGETILVSQHNPAMLDIQQALSSSLDRDGLGGMRADLSMGGHKISNAAEGVFAGDVATVGQLRSGPITAVAASTIDTSQGNYFTTTVAANTTFSFTNVPAGAYGFTLRVTHTSGSITWPASVRWPKGTAPVPTIGRTHLFMFATDNGGTTWRGAALLDYTA